MRTIPPDRNCLIELKIDPKLAVYELSLSQELHFITKYYPNPIKNK